MNSMDMIRFFSLLHTYTDISAVGRVVYVQKKKVYGSVCDFGSIVDLTEVTVLSSALVCLKTATTRNTIQMRIQHTSRSHAMQSIYDFCSSMPERFRVLKLLVR